MELLDLFMGGLGAGAIVFIVVFSIIGCFMFTIAVGRMAKRYGRSAAFYVILSFFITPFGSAFILFCSGETEECRRRRMSEFEKLLSATQYSKPHSTYSAYSGRVEEHTPYMPR